MSGQDRFKPISLGQPAQTSSATHTQPSAPAAPGAPGMPHSPVTFTAQPQFQNGGIAAPQGLGPVQAPFFQPNVAAQEPASAPSVSAGPVSAGPMSFTAMPAQGIPAAMPGAQSMPVSTSNEIQAAQPASFEAGSEGKPMAFFGTNSTDVSVEQQYNYVDERIAQVEYEKEEVLKNASYNVLDLERHIPDFDAHYDAVHAHIKQKYEAEVNRLASLESKGDHSPEQMEEMRKAFRKQALEYSKTFVRMYAEQNKLQLPLGLTDYWAKYQIEDMYAYSVLTDVIDDETVTEIIGYRYEKFRVEREGKRTPLDIRFRSNSHMKDTVDRLIRRTGRTLTDASPNVDARLPNKSRLSASISPISVNGCEVTIRKFPKEPWKWDELLRRGAVTPRVQQFIQAIVKSKQSMLVSGGTGAGKTTLLNVVSNDMVHDEEVLVIENVHELNLALDYVRYFEERLGENPYLMAQILVDALRKAPKAIVVGEVRGGEAMTLLQALSTGHYGYGTGHADSPQDMVYNRLNAMVLMGGVDWGPAVINRIICSSIPFITQVSRMRDGSRKIVQITELLGVDQDGATKWGQLTGKPDLLHDASRLGLGYVYFHDLFTFHEDGLDAQGRVVGHYEESPYRPYTYELLQRSGLMQGYWE